jgi:hypothetical protein
VARILRDVQAFNGRRNISVLVNPALWSSEQS